jgi:hypothetical protein
MKQICFISLCLLLLCSCSKVYYWFDPPPAYSQRLQKIPFDSTYQLFVRTVCRLTAVNRTHELCNCQDPRFGVIPKTKAEVEYLFLSQRHGKAIYITTLPYIDTPHYELSLHQQDNNVVLSDLNRIQIGNYNVAQNRLEFETVPDLTTRFWHLSFQPNFLNIDSVVSYPSSIKHYAYTTKELKNQKKITRVIPATTLSTGLHFYPQPNFQLIMDSLCWNTRTVRGLQDDNLYIVPSKKAYEVVFRLTSTWANNPNFTHVYFTTPRLTARPPQPVR